MLTDGDSVSQGWPSYKQVVVKHVKQYLTNKGIYIFIYCIFIIY